jgi:hypothetical protein
MMSLQHNYDLYFVPAGFYFMFCIMFHKYSAPKGIIIINYEID